MNHSVTEITEPKRVNWDRVRKTEAMERCTSFILLGSLPGGDTLQRVATLRTYMSRDKRSTTVRAVAYVDIPSELPHVGEGSAAGGGYCKTSAAIADALEAAGLRFDFEIWGRGESVVQRALLAIGSKLGRTHLHIVQE